MLKNRTREQIRNKFNFNYNILNQHIKETLETINEEGEEEETEKFVNNNLAIIDVPNYLEPPVFKNSKPLLICLFQIVTEGLYPFLLYLLHKNGTEEVQFIKRTSFDEGKNNKSLKRKAIDYMENILSEGEISYVGFLETNVNNMLFLKYVPAKDFRRVPENYYWTTPHEIVNSKAVMNMPIASTVTTFFLTNPGLLTLKNENELIYDSPMIGYYTSSDLYLSFINPALGKAYYLYSALPTKNGAEEITRVVFFPGKMCLGMNESFANCDSILCSVNNMQDFIIKKYNQQTGISTIQRSSLSFSSL
jgi:hypothetical protein